MVRKLAAWLTTAALISFAIAIPVLAQDVDPFDPQGAGGILGSVLTLSGGTVAAALVAAFIQYALKPIGGGFGTWVDAHEQLVTLILGAALIGYAAAATGYAFTAISGFGLLVAWLGFAKLTGGVYDGVRAAKVAVDKATG